MEVDWMSKVMDWIREKYNGGGSVSETIGGVLTDVLSGFGINLGDLSADQQKLWQMKSSLMKMLQEATNGYQTYVAETYNSKPLNDTKALEDALNQLTNQQSDFSRFLNGYAPFSTAKKAAQLRFRTLSNAAEQASKALTAAQAANVQIENENQAGREAVEKLNSAKAAAVDKANAAIDSRVNNINSLINQVSALENMSALAKTTDV